MKTFPILYFSKQIKKSISLTIIENGFGHDDAIYHILIDSVLKENFEKVNFYFPLNFCFYLKI